MTEQNYFVVIVKTIDGKEAEHKYPTKTVENFTQTFDDLAPRIKRAFTKSNSFLGLEYPLVVYNSRHLIQVSLRHDGPNAGALEKRAVGFLRER